MANKTASKKEQIIPIRLTNDELLIRFKSPEERNRIEEQKILEEKRKIEESSQLEKQRKRLAILKNILLFILILIVGSFLYLLIQYVNPKNTIVTDVPASLNLGLVYTAPKNLAVGDENIVEVTLSNSGSVPFNGIVTLVISDPDSSVTSSLGRTMSIPIEDLLPNDRLTGQFKIKLSKDPAVESIKFHFQITLLDKNSGVVSSDVTSGGVFFISPIQRLRSIWVWVTGGSGLIVLVINFLFDRFKNLLGVQK